MSKQRTVIEGSDSWGGVPEALDRIIENGNRIDAFSVVQIPTHEAGAWP